MVTGAAVVVNPRNERRIQSFCYVLGSVVYDGEVICLVRGAFIKKRNIARSISL